MATETQVDAVPAMLHGSSVNDILTLHTNILLGVHKRLEGIPAKATPFRVTAPSQLSQSGSLQVPLISAHRGEITTLTNSNAVPTTIEIYESNGQLVLRVAIAANDYKSLTVPFFDRLFITKGAGIIVSGNVFE